MVGRAAEPGAVPVSGAAALHHAARVVGVALLAIGVVAVMAALAVHGELGLLTVVGSMVAVGAVICWKRPREPVGWLLVAAGLLFGVSSVAVWSVDVVNALAQPPSVAVFGAWLDEWAYIPTLTLTFVVLPMLLPDGRPSSPTFGWLLRVSVVVMAAWTATAMLSSRLAEEAAGRSRAGIANPIGVLPLSDVENPPVSWLIIGTGAASFVIAAVSLVTRYRRSIGLERSQLRWIAYGSVMTIVGFVVVAAAPLPQYTINALHTLLLPLMPLSIGVAVLRHNLYDIDRLISRTVAYGTVTALLAATYLALVFVLRAALPVHGDLAVAASTLAVAALFNPLRRRVQRVVDRRFNRARVDAARTVDAFAGRLRSQFDVIALADDLEAVVERTMQPTSVSVWLHDEPRATSPGAPSRSDAAPSAAS